MGISNYAKRMLEGSFSAVSKLDFAIAWRNTDLGIEARLCSCVEKSRSRSFELFFWRRSAASSNTSFKLSFCSGKLLTVH